MGSPHTSESRSRRFILGSSARQEAPLSIPGWIRTRIPILPLPWPPPRQGHLSSDLHLPEHSSQQHPSSRFCPGILSLRTIVLKNIFFQEPPPNISVVIGCPSSQRASVPGSVCVLVQHSPPHLVERTILLSYYASPLVRLPSAGTSAT